MPAGLGLLATILASVGLYGVMAFVVARREKELGIRHALGARPGPVIRMVMREVLVLLSIGLGVGIPAAIARPLRVGVALWHSGSGPLDCSGTVVLLAVVSGPSGLIPAHRASQIDPMLALRYE